MRFKQILAIFFIAGFSSGTNWIPDTGNAKINFTIEGIFGTVHGSFSGLQATIVFDEKNLPSGSMSASVDVKTVSTGNSLRNSDLRNKDQWFNVDKYPRISFHSKKFEKTSNGYQVLGDLTIKGITKAVTIPFTFTNDGGNGVFKGQFTLKRLDYNLGKPGGSVGAVATIMLEIPVKSDNHK